MAPSRLASAFRKTSTTLLSTQELWLLDSESQLNPIFFSTLKAPGGPVWRRKPVGPSQVVGRPVKGWEEEKD